MITLQEWKMIGVALIIFSYLVIFILGIISKIKNKKRKIAKKKTTHRYAKIDLYDYLTCKMKQEYIGQKKVIFNELVRM